jgi:hypothetical protein
VSVQVTRAGEGVPFESAADDHGVTPSRLHGPETGNPNRLVMSSSVFPPGAAVDLARGDSVHLASGAVRSIGTESGCTLLVVRYP